jgi:vancomycin permeability regulator SanA
MKYTLIGLVSALVVYATVFTLYALLPRSGPADLAVVLGNEVLADGQPSRRLAARLDQAASVYREGLVPLILVSGGRGESGFDEASVMRDYLVQAGIPEAAILLDSDGVNTLATARNTMVVMRRLQLQRVLIVTQYFHIPRCLLAFDRVGAQHPLATYPDFIEARDLYSLPRELVGFPAYLMQARDEAKVVN